MAGICPDFKWLGFQISDPTQNLDHLQSNVFLTIWHPDEFRFQIPTVIHGKIRLKPVLVFLQNNVKPFDEDGDAAMGESNQLDQGLGRGRGQKRGHNQVRFNQIFGFLLV